MQKSKSTYISCAGEVLHSVQPFPFFDKSLCGMVKFELEVCVYTYLVEPLVQDAGRSVAPLQHVSFSASFFFIALISKAVFVRPSVIKPWKC